MSPAAAEMAGSFSGIPVAFREFWVARGKSVLVARTALLVKATWEFALKATQPAPFPEVTVEHRWLSENPPALGKPRLRSGQPPVMPGRVACPP
jgi:hypothetical protein